MTADQASAFALMGVTVALFIWGRLPYELVALLALLVGVVIGIIPATQAFAGFGHDVVIIVATALLVSAAIARSGVIETVMRPLLRRVTGQRRELPALVGAVTLVSMVTKNVGALAMFMPLAQQTARRSGRPLSRLLMPMAFGSLLGGLVTLVGTPPNIIIAKVRADLLGKPFAMFDFTPVGLGVALAGFVYLVAAQRLLPVRQAATTDLQAQFGAEGYTAEVRVPADSPLVGRAAPEVEALGERLQLRAVIRERFRRLAPTSATCVEVDDLLLLQGEPDDLEQFIARNGLVLPEEGPGEPATHHVVEAVVTADSPLVGRTPRQADLAGEHGLALLALSRSGRAIHGQLATVRLAIGDLLIVKGARAALGQVLSTLRLLPLSERDIALGARRRSWLPLLVLAAAMFLVAVHAVPVAVAFAGAAAAVLLLRILTMDEAYRTIEWSVIILIGALIPVSGAIQATGGTALIAEGLQHLAQYLPPAATLALVLITAMAVAQFVNNTAAVLVLGPIAGALALRLHLNPDAFLMAVAIGAASGFATPLGHQSNLLVLGPGGYRFGDFARLGLPLSLVVVAVAVPLIVAVWGLS